MDVLPPGNIPVHPDPAHRNGRDPEGPEYQSPRVQNLSVILPPSDLIRRPESVVPQRPLTDTRIPGHSPLPPKPSEEEPQTVERAH
ncbi:hypothetical protein CMUS01_02799 [Colletotrichum musicola]|uniref:Uncharacterized protein n=1 Tax=Colletotrichum musicola TaxID=2175873 RepID=A0A8H6NUD5_9PEZI|nr:hypothetical protein CMUS01_02799 [Colletotrichum musicola]